MPSGLAVIREIGTGNPNGVNVLLLDENMTPDDHSGKDGVKLNEEIQIHNLETLLHIINISNEPKLNGFQYVGPFIPVLEKLLLEL